MNTHTPSTTARRTLAQLLQADRCTMASSVFDPVSARLAQHIGSECGVLGGSAASQVILGAPDLILITATELVEQARRICRLNAVELIVDADHGYGNALNVMRTTQDLQAAGVAGICLEDTKLPREFGSSSKPRLITIEEQCNKLRAAIQARGTGPMQILGRTNALEITDMSDTIERLQAYEKIGVDALFIPYVRSRDDLDQLAQALTLPIILVGAHPSVFDLDYLSSRRVKIWMWGHHPLAHATTTLYEVMLAAHKGIAPSALPTQHDPALAPIMTAFAHFSELTKRYLDKN